MWYYVWRIGMIILNMIDFRIRNAFIIFINEENRILK